MTGWFLLAGIALGAGAALWLLRFPRRLWTVPATAITLAASGYAWQGSPALPGHAAEPVREADEIDPGLIALREAMFGRFNFSYNYFGAADAMTRAGDPGAAAMVMLGATGTGPRDAAVWTGLGFALAERDGSIVTPTARFAYDRAMALAPAHPGPPFFLGLSLIREGRFAEARPFWARAAELAPATISYREELTTRLALLDRLIEAQAAAQRGQAPGP